MYMPNGILVHVAIASYEMTQNKNDEEKFVPYK